jgi:hypothetical protein
MEWTFGHTGKFLVIETKRILGEKITKEEAEFFNNYIKVSIEYYKYQLEHVEKIKPIEIDELK